MKPGLRRFYGELMDSCDRDDGELPKTRVLRNYSHEEVEDVKLGLKKKHWKPHGGALKIGVDGLVEEAGGAAIFRAETCRVLEREPVNLGAQRRASEEKLLKTMREHLPKKDLEVYLAAWPRGSTWMQRSLTDDGLDATQRRIEALGTMFSQLPLGQEEPLRQFVARTLRDSHALDDDDVLRGAFEKCVKRRHEEFDLEEAYLMEGLVRRATGSVVLVSGPITLSFGNEEVSSQPLCRLGEPLPLTEGMLRNGRLVRIPRQALLVENPSTWASLRRKVPQDLLLILADGFPNRAVSKLAKMLGEAGTQLLHWGDIDAGGMRILAFLQTVAEVQPFLMDEATLETYQSRLTKFRGTKRATIEHARVDFPLLGMCLEMQGWLEQESIPVSDALLHLEQTLGPIAGQAPSV